MSFPARVRVVEVGPRDGLQNEKSVIVPTEVKVELITRLKAAGLTSIEAGSFVRADWVPQMADTPQVLRSLRNAGKVDLKEDVTVLTPNAKGLVGALDAGVGEVAVFGAASESFSQKNINASIDKSLANFEIVAKEAIKNGDLVL
jgi:isopropylmalate/homocitrate/citramalate synthase